MSAQLPPVDLARAALLSDMLGPVRLVALLELLSARLDAIAGAVRFLPAGRDQLVASVHQSQGSAGSLGLNAVMVGLRNLEHMLSSTAPGHEVEIAALVATFRDARNILESHLPDFHFSRN